MSAHPSIPEEALHPSLRSPLWKKLPTGWVCRCVEPPEEFGQHEERCVPTVPWFECILGTEMLHFLAGTTMAPPYYTPRAHYTIETFVHEVPEGEGWRKHLWDGRSPNGMEPHGKLCNTLAPNYDIICVAEEGHELPHLGANGELMSRLHKKLGLCLWTRVWFSSEMQDRGVRQIMEVFPGSDLL